MRLSDLLKVSELGWQLNRNPAGELLTQNFSAFPSMCVNWDGPSQNVCSSFCWDAEPGSLKDKYVCVCIYTKASLYYIRISLPENL